MRDVYGRKNFSTVSAHECTGPASKYKSGEGGAGSGADVIPWSWYLIRLRRWWFVLENRF